MKIQGLILRYFQDDGKIERELLVAGANVLSSTPTTTYVLHVRTGDVRNAGTDANVYCQIFGMMMILSDASKRGCSFFLCVCVCVRGSNLYLFLHSFYYLFI